MTARDIAATTGRDRLRGILELVEESLDEPELSGEDLAGRAYLSRFHFDRLAAAALGEPPGAFRRRVLLERAAHRLAHTSRPVIDVAFEAGYASPEAFTRAFTRVYGAAPSRWRARPGGHRLAATSGIHFHPPGSLHLPAAERTDGMDVLTRMIDHHLDLTGRILDRAGGVGDDVLDRPIELSVEGIDEDPTLRRVCGALVGQLEMWVHALEGGDRMPPEGDLAPAALRERLGVAGPRFRELVVGALEEGRADETFVDAVCDPPRTFTYGGVAAHVLTFAAVRRTFAIGALDRAGVTDLGAGDPMREVGGAGADASSLTRRR